MFEINNGVLIKCNCTDEIITLPNDVKEITHKAFTDCNVKEIICNDGLKKISAYSFINSKLKKIVLPSTLEYIGDYAFMNTKIKSIIIPSSVNKIGKNPFMCCSNLEEIIVDDNNSYYSSYNNTNSICEVSTHTLISGCKNSIIKDGIVAISDNAFNKVGLKTIMLPDSVKTLGRCCFADNCIEKINLNCVENAFDGVLMDNNYLKELSVSNYIKTIYPALITRCDKLDVVTLGNSVKLITTDSFYNFLGSTISIDNSVEVIEERAFSFCVRLKNIKFNGTKEQWLKAIANRNVFYTNKTEPCKYSVVCIDGEITVNVFIH